MSPYHAMGCNPAMLTDPLGLKPALDMTSPNHGGGVAPIGHMVEGKFVVFGAGRIPNFFAKWGLDDQRAHAQFLADNAAYRSQAAIVEIWAGLVMQYGGGEAGDAVGDIQSLVSAVYSGTYNYDPDFEGTMLPEMIVTNGKADYAGWGASMHSRFGGSLGWDFNGYGQQSNGGGSKKWFFEVNAEVTVGLQVGGAVNVGELNAGLKANLVNVKLWEGKATQTGSNRAPWVTSSTFIGKNDKYTVSNSVDLGPGSWEQSFDRNIGQTGYISDSHNHKFSLGPLTYNSNPQEGSYIEIGGKAALILGISGSIKFGLR